METDQIAACDGIENDQAVKAAEKPVKKARKSSKAKAASDKDWDVLNRKSFIWQCKPAPVKSGKAKAA